MERETIDMDLSGVMPSDRAMVAELLATLNARKKDGDTIELAKAMMFTGLLKIAALCVSIMSSSKMDVKSFIDLTYVAAVASATRFGRLNANWNATGGEVMQRWKGQITKCLEANNMGIQNIARSVDAFLDKRWNSDSKSRNSAGDTGVPRSTLSYLGIYFSGCYYTGAVAGHTYKFHFQMAEMRDAINDMVDRIGKEPYQTEKETTVGEIGVRMMKADVGCVRALSTFFARIWPNKKLTPPDLFTESDPTNGIMKRISPLQFSRRILATPELQAKYLKASGFEVS